MPPNNKNFYDVIVIGIGSMGAPTCYHLAQQGHKVLGLEQFDIPHEYGSHTGQSRIIRKAYYEHPDYVPLLQRAYDNWSQFEQTVGTQLFHRTGLAYFGEKNHILMKGARESARLYHVPIHELNKEEAQKRFPQFQVPDTYETFFEPNAGFVLPEKTISLYYERALRLGADIKTKEGALSWEKKGTDIVVHTKNGAYTAKKLIIAAGGWAKKLIPPLKEKLRVTRQTVVWVKPKNWEFFSQKNFPTWVIGDPDYPGIFYGFPILSPTIHPGPVGLKIAHHAPYHETNPNVLNEEVPKEDLETIRYALKKYFPEAEGPALTIKTCLYTNTPDEHFIMDHLPGYDQSVVIASGFSGHGFKFAPMVGETVADLAMKGRTDMPIGFLNVKRFLV